MEQPPQYESSSPPGEPIEAIRSNFEAATTARTERVQQIALLKKNKIDLPDSLSYFVREAEWLKPNPKNRQQVLNTLDAIMSCEVQETTVSNSYGLDMGADFSTHNLLNLFFCDDVYYLFERSWRIKSGTVRDKSEEVGVYIFTQENDYVAHVTNIDEKVKDKARYFRKESYSNQIVELVERMYRKTRIDSFALKVADVLRDAPRSTDEPYCYYTKSRDFVEGSIKHTVLARFLPDQDVLTYTTKSSRCETVTFTTTDTTNKQTIEHSLNIRDSYEKAFGGYSNNPELEKLLGVMTVQLEMALLCEEVKP